MTTPRVSAWLEGAGILLLLASGAAVLGRYAHAMATTSLWTDELHAIVYYLPHGPLALATNYPEPNNHIFFNLVNAMTPGPLSVEPLRARAWSFLAFFATLGAGVAFHARRGAWLSGAVFFAALSIQPELPALMLQARGYSFLCFSSLAAAILAARLAQAVDRRALVGLALVTVAGAWTVPTFALFVMPLWLGVLVLQPRRPVVVASLGAGLGILLVYAPVAAEVWSQARHYGDQWGRQFANLEAVGETFRLYLLHPTVVGRRLTNHELLLLAAAGTGVLAMAVRRSPRDGRPLLALFAATAAFFGICRLLQTPPIRATAFIVVPVVFAGSHALELLVRGDPGTRRALVAVVLGLFVGYRALAQVEHFSFVPLEQWKEMGAALCDTVPPGTPFFVSAKRDFLAGYLAPGYEPTAHVDKALFSQGEELLLDTPQVEPAGGRLDARPLAADAVEFRIPQQRTGYQALWFCAPMRSFVVAAHLGSVNVLGAVTDRRLSTTTGEPSDLLMVQLEPGHRYRSLVVVSASGPELVADVRDERGLSIAPGPSRRWRNVTLLNLRDEPVIGVLLRPKTPEQRLGPVEEVWAYPSERQP